MYGATWPPEIDPVTGLAQSFVDAVLENPYGLNITSAQISATANVSPGGVSGTAQASYPLHATAEAYTTNEPSQTITYTASGSFKLESLLVTDTNGQLDMGVPETWSVSPTSATWSPDWQPEIYSVTMIPTPLQAGTQGYIFLRAG